MGGTQVPRKRLSGDDLAEHPANRGATGISALDAKANELDEEQAKAPAGTQPRPFGCARTYGEIKECVTIRRHLAGIPAEADFEYCDRDRGR
jgi:hypothetical protein